MDFRPFLLPRLSDELITENYFPRTILNDQKKKHNIERSEEKAQYGTIRIKSTIWNDQNKKHNIEQ